MARVLALLLVLAACGRIGYDQRPLVADDTLDLDAPPAIPACAPGMTELVAGSAICIEQAQRGSKTWTDAKADCESLGRRLCADAEWFTACVNATGLSAMTGDDYEWVAEQANGVAQKRGATDCNDMSAHEIFVDPYGYRCCGDKQ